MEQKSYHYNTCKFADDCPVYNEQISGMISPNRVIKNVFCKRGEKGWKNCIRYAKLENGQEVSEIASPYND